MRNVKIEKTADGIAIVSLDVADSQMNVLSPAVIDELSTAVESLVASEDVIGVVITSAKKDFAAGWDLKDLLGMLDAGLPVRQALECNRAFPALLRRIETCGKPFAAAINGLALGGGLELTLACHYRVLSSDERVVVGLPEVKVGLLPGAGGTQRLPRLIGLANALPLLLTGESVEPARAAALGIVHEVAPADQVVEKACAWLRTRPAAQAPWDRKGFTVPGGASIADPAIGSLYTRHIASVQKSTLRNYPAPAAILSAVFEGAPLPIDKGLAIESKYFARLATERTARNMVRTLFVNKGRADRLVKRPAGIERTRVRKVGVLGAGMMGTGIALVSAAAGIQVVLLDVTVQRAEQGRQQCAGLLQKDVSGGRRSASQAAEILDRIRATERYEDLSDCDFIVEAVFEDRAVKNDVIARTNAVLAPDAVFSSNTSTLPISGLAEQSADPKRFIGVHFFSPVHRMPLVEIIVGRETSEVTVARALDYVAQLRKTPIVVNDRRGFYTSRVFGTYWSEGQKMLSEGIHPALIENAGRFAGMPVGPLAVSDEVSIELQYKALRQGAIDLGDAYEYPVSWPVVRHFVEDLKRLGRKSGGGFYEYPAGGRKYLWPGLADEYPLARRQPALEEVKKRLLHIQALETVRCLEENVLTSVEEADIGSVLGWSFPSYTGGTLSYIDSIGVARFVSECQEFADRLGPRFAPTEGLLERARRGERFHPKAPWVRAVRAA